MKAFVVSLSIILIIFTFTIINSIYIHNVTDELISAAEGLNIDDDSICRFTELWEDREFTIRLSSSHEETHKIDEALSVLTAKAQEGSSSGFCEERALLVEYLKQIQEDEKITLDSII